MHISICIVAFRNPDEIAACLTALAAQTYADFDIVVTENGGSAAFADLMACTASVRDSLPIAVEVLQAPGNLGYAGGVNHCMRARPDSDGWWIVNPDTQPRPDALSALVDRIAEGDCHAAGSVLYHPDGKVQAYGGRWRHWLARPVSIGMGQSVDAPIDRAAVETQMNYILGASMLVDRQLVDRIGLMRDDYFLYCEEVEWALRAVMAGERLGLAERSLVQHGQGGTTGSAAPIRQRPRLPIYMDERNKLNVVRDTGAYRLPVAMAAALVILTMRYAARGAWRQWGYALAGWWAGVRGQRGLPPWMR